MSPEFKAGIERALEKIKVFAVRNAPVIAGLGSGAIIGRVMSPRQEPDRYQRHGAVIGGLVGLSRLKKWRANLPSRWQVTP